MQRFFERVCLPFRLWNFLCPFLGAGFWKKETLDLYSIFFSMYLCRPSPRNFDANHQTNERFFRPLNISVDRVDTFIDLTFTASLVSIVSGVAKLGPGLLAE